MPKDTAAPVRQWQRDRDRRETRSLMADLSGTTALAKWDDPRPKRSLYVSRPVHEEDARRLFEWSTALGLPGTLVRPDDMHVTITYSRREVRWSDMGAEEPMLWIMEGGPRELLRLGPDGTTVGLAFVSPSLEDRNRFMRAMGASYDFDAYIPHITIAKDVPLDIPLEVFVPYQREIALGAERFEGLDDDLAKWNPHQPRAQDGKWTAGGGGGMTAPQLGQGGTAAASFRQDAQQAGFMKPLTQAELMGVEPYLGNPLGLVNMLPREPSDNRGDENAEDIATFVSGVDPGPGLNGVPFTPWAGPENGDWSTVGGTGSFEEPPPPATTGQKGLGAGVVIEEPDGRVWTLNPLNNFGGYNETLPKGGIEPGLNLRQTAIKEAYEETGLQVELTGYLGDFERTTSVARYYRARRIGGDPTDFHWETAATNLIPRSEWKDRLSHPSDRPIRAAMEGLDEAIIKAYVDASQLAERLQALNASHVLIHKKKAWSDQPRVPAGVGPNGGQWTKGGYGGGSWASNFVEADLPLALQKYNGGGPQADKLNASIEAMEQAANDGKLTTYAQKLIQKEKPAQTYSAKAWASAWEAKHYIDGMAAKPASAFGDTPAGAGKGDASKAPDAPKSELTPDDLGQYDKGGMIVQDANDPNTVSVEFQVSEVTEYAPSTHSVAAHIQTADGTDNFLTAMSPAGLATKVTIALEQNPGAKVVETIGLSSKAPDAPKPSASTLGDLDAGGKIQSSDVAGSKEVDFAEGLEQVLIPNDHYVAALLVDPDGNYHVESAISAAGLHAKIQQVMAENEGTGVAETVGMKGSKMPIPVNMGDDAPKTTAPPAPAKPGSLADIATGIQKPPPGTPKPYGLKPNPAGEPMLGGDLADFDGFGVVSSNLALFGVINATQKLPEGHTATALMQKPDGQLIVLSAENPKALQGKIDAALIAEPALELKETIGTLGTEGAIPVTTTLSDGEGDVLGSPTSMVKPGTVNVRAPAEMPIATQATATTAAPSGPKTLPNEIKEGVWGSGDDPMPLSFMDKVGGKPGGTAAGGLFKAGTTTYMVKAYDSEQQAYMEAGTSRLYRIAGMHSPLMAIVNTEGAFGKKKGPHGVGSKWDDSLKKFNENNPQHIKAAQEDFAAHVLFNNYDAIGASFDNVLVNAAGEVVMVDPGGSFNRRATGGTKTFGPDIDLFDSMRDPTINPNAAKVFGKMTQSDLIASMKKAEANLAGPDGKLKPEVREAYLMMHPKGKLGANASAQMDVLQSRLDKMVEKRIQMEADLASATGVSIAQTGIQTATLAHAHPEVQQMAQAPIYALSSLNEANFDMATEDIDKAKATYLSGDGKTAENAMKYYGGSLDAAMAAAEKGDIDGVLAAAVPVPKSGKAQIGVNYGVYMQAYTSIQSYAVSQAAKDLKTSGTTGDGSLVTGAAKVTPGMIKAAQGAGKGIDVTDASDAAKMAALQTQTSKAPSPEQGLPPAMPDPPKLSSATNPVTKSLQKHYDQMHTVANSGSPDAAAQLLALTVSVPGSNTYSKNLQKWGGEAIAALGGQAEIDKLPPIAKKAALEKGIAKAVVAHKDATQAPTAAEAASAATTAAQTVQSATQTSAMGETKEITTSAGVTFLQTTQTVPFNPDAIKEPPDFMNWHGPGKGLSTNNPEVNVYNAKHAAAMFDAAKSNDLATLMGIEAGPADPNTAKHLKAYKAHLIKQLNEVGTVEKTRDFISYNGSSSAAAAATAIADGFKTYPSAPEFGKHKVLGHMGGPLAKQLYDGIPMTTASTSSKLAGKMHDDAMKMTTEQQQAYKNHIGHGYLWEADVNEMLNPQPGTTGYKKAMKNAKLVQDGAHALPTGLTLSRKVNNGTFAEWQAQVGNTINQPSLASTSINPNAWSGKVWLKLRLAEGVEGAYVGSASKGTAGWNPKVGKIGLSGEDEVVLPANTKWTVASVKKGSEGDDFFSGAPPNVTIVEIIVTPHDPLPDF